MNCNMKIPMTEIYLLLDIFVSLLRVHKVLKYIQFQLNAH